MKFEERLKNYQLGLLDEDEKAKLEDEIEKYRAIEAYLLNDEPNFEDELFNRKDDANLNCNENIADSVVNADTDDNKNKIEAELHFNKRIKKNVNKRFVKMGVVVALVLIVLYIAVMYAVPNIVNLFYYNPVHHTAGDPYEDVFYDLKAITSLTEPGYETSFVNVNKQGYGKYKLYVVYKDLFTYQNIFTEESIDKNMRLTTRSRDFYGTDMQISQFYEKYDDYPRELFMLGNKEENLNYMDKLSSVAYVATYVTFSEDMSLEQLERYQEKYPKLKFAWVNVKTEADPNSQSMYLGFSPNVNSSYGDKILFDKFPYFQLNDWHYNTDAFFTESYPWNEGYAEHFKALLGYVADRGSAIDQIDTQFRLTSSKAKDALEYVNTNGIALQGMLIYGETEDLLVYLKEDQNVEYIFIESVLTTKPDLMYRLN
ncbi:anti sigma factor C-terminal domain-containing protein [Fusibacter bizertensis]